MQQQQYVLNVEEKEEESESEWYGWGDEICDDEDIVISALIPLGPIV